MCFSFHRLFPATITSVCTAMQWPQMEVSIWLKTKMVHPTKRLPKCVLPYLQLSLKTAEDFLLVCLKFADVISFTPSQSLKKLDSGPVALLCYPDDDM